MIRFIFSLVFIIVFFNGCISLTKELPPLSTYSIDVENKKVEGKYFDISIKVNEPKALSSLNSKEIVYSKYKTSQEAYALSRWSDKPSKLIQKNVANFLTNQNTYKLISTSNIKIDSDYVLNGEIQTLKHQFIEDNSYAIFSIRVYLINTNTQDVYFKNFSYKKQLNQNNAKAFVQEVDNITLDFLIDLQKFIQNKLSK
jgi:cholesterol transport system auxiliary component